jgi:broad specificity phosphatase PhoE
VAQKLEIPYRVMEGLHEHVRETAPYFDTKEAFLTAVATFFYRPDELVFGDETALQAQKRFAGAIESVLTTYPQENVAIVTHGTVLSLFASQYVGQEIYPFWQSLGLPAIVAFSYPEMELLAQVNEVV